MRNEFTLAFIKKLLVPLIARLQLRVFVTKSVPLCSLKLLYIEPNTTASLISETIPDDPLNEGDDLGNVFGNTSDGIGRQHAETSHVVGKLGFPVRGELTTDGNGIGNGIC